MRSRGSRNFVFPTCESYDDANYKSLTTYIALFRIAQNRVALAARPDALAVPVEEGFASI